MEGKTKELKKLLSYLSSSGIYSVYKNLNWFEITLVKVLLKHKKEEVTS